MPNATDKDTRTIIYEELEALRKRIVANIEATGSTASGRTAQSLRVEANPNKGILYGREYFATLETGRKPGKVPQNFTEILKQWVKDKGWAFDSIEDRDETISGIYWNIVKTGTKLFRQGGRKDIFTPEIPKTINNISSRVMKSFVESVKIKQSITTVHEDA